MSNTANPKMILTPPAVPTVAVGGTESRFPVNRIFCVGRNYAAHAEEMGMAVDRESPFYFTKSASTIVASGTTVPYPPGTRNYHHEIELVVAIDKPTFCVAVKNALEIVFGYACGLDMTRRDLQLEARDKGRPWDLGKNFENSAVISEIITVSQSGHIQSGDIRLSVNGDLRQVGDIRDLIWSVPELIADLSRYYHLQPGDLLYTGTPAGVGPVEAGDIIRGSIDQVGEIEFTLAASENTH
ncbi:MAG: fumarylacetoacetate hydrolase family protein [Proteobacteria bacterium]|nr:fumarylacetoacetate hydrolase family protein [Pseudomonadota bacterium]